MGANHIKLNRKIIATFHGLGLSCLCCAVFIQVLMLINVFQKGYFIGIEYNPVILFSELTLSFFGTIYFAYIDQLIIRALIKKHLNTKHTQTLKWKTPSASKIRFIKVRAKTYLKHQH